MKKIWLIFLLVIIIMAQITFIFSFQSTSAYSKVTGTSAVVVSKMKYAYAQVSIHIRRSQFDSEVTLIFPNGTQKEILPKVQPQEIHDFIYTLDVFLARSGDFLGDHNVNTFYGSIYNFSSLIEEPTLSLSRDHPIDIDIVPNVDKNFLKWYTLPYTDDPKYIDIYWFKIQGDAYVDVIVHGGVI